MLHDLKATAKRRGVMRLVKQKQLQLLLNSTSNSSTGSRLKQRQ
jgi:hypothetical protein